MNTIPVLYSFARSGGTLVNQLLGVHPRCLVLSEVNPAASVKPVAEQAREWLGLEEPEHAADLSALPYHLQIATLRARAEAQGKALVVRDWVTVNFLPRTSGERVAPSKVLEQEIYLARAGLSPAPIVVARRAAAVYDSIRRNFAHLGRLAIEEFAPAYLAYAQAVAHWPRVHMEDLREDPVPTLRRILERVGLDARAPEALLEGFGDFRRCTGNVTLDATSGSARARTILPPERPSRGKGSHSEPAMAEADRLFDYV